MNPFKWFIDSYKYLNTQYESVDRRSKSMKASRLIGITQSAAGFKRVIVDNDYKFVPVFDNPITQEGHDAYVYKKHNSTCPYELMSEKSAWYDGWCMAIKLELCGPVKTPVRGKGATTAEALGVLSKVIDEAPTRFEISREIARRIGVMISKLELRDISIYMSNGKYEISSTFGSSYVDDHRGGM